MLWKKYCSPRRLNNINVNKLPCSAIWTTIKKGMGTFSKGSRWMVGRESTLKVWHCNWTSRGSLWQMIQKPLSQEENQLEFRDFILDTGWDWSKISFELHVDIKLTIQATPISLTRRGKDVLAWSESPQGKFELKSAYKLVESFESDSNFAVMWIWRADTLPRIRFFLWQCVHNNIKVKVCLVRIGVIEVDKCPIC